MNKDTIMGKWEEIKGMIKKTWGKLTDDEITQFKGTRDELVGMLQRKYGEKREDIERKLDEFMQGKESKKDDEDKK